MIHFYKGYAIDKPEGCEYWNVHEIVNGIIDYCFSLFHAKTLKEVRITIDEYLKKIIVKEEVMEALFFTKEEARIMHNALNTRAVDLMKQINDTYVYCDPDKAPEIREKLYDEVDGVDALLDRLKYWDMQVMLWETKFQILN